MPIAKGLHMRQKACRISIALSQNDRRLDFRLAIGLDMAGDRLDHVVRRHIQPVAPENYGASVCCQNMIIRFVNEFRKIEAGFFANFAPHIGVHVDPGSIEIVRFQ